MRPHSSPHLHNKEIYIQLHAKWLNICLEIIYNGPAGRCERGVHSDADADVESKELESERRDQCSPNA